MKLYLALLLIPVVSVIINCSDNPVKKDDGHSPIVGVWEDSTSSTTAYFDDSTWRIDLNSGTYTGADEGTLYLFGQAYADYQYKDGVLHVEELIENGDVLIFTQTSSEAPTDVYLVSSHTRRGNFIAFSSNRDGDENGDIYIYTVDSNAYLDTVFYFDLLISVNRDTVYDTATVNGVEKIDTNVTQTSDTTLIKKFIDPIRGLAVRTGLDAMPSWSPDGRKLAYVSDEGGYQAIWIYFLDEFAAPLPLSDTVPANPIKLTEPGSEKNDANPTWSPDGNFIAFERRDTEGSGNNLRDIYMISAENYGEADPAYNFTRAPEDDCFNPEWSPSEEVNTILFERRQNGTSSDWDVYWTRADDSSGFDPDVDKDKKFTNPNKNGHPTWSPDCEKVAFEISPPGSDSQYSVNVKSYLDYDSVGTEQDSLLDSAGISAFYGGKGLELTAQADFPGFNRYPTWLPNGHLIAFIRENDIWLIDISAGFHVPSHRRLLEDDFKNWDIAW